MADVAIPVLASLDFSETVAFYEKLGFDKARTWPDYAIVGRGSVEIHFWKCDDRKIAEATSCYLRVDDVDAYHLEWAQVVEESCITDVEDRPWGMREFAVWDPHGNLVKVGQVIDRIIGQAIGPAMGSA